MEKVYYNVILRGERKFTDIPTESMKVRVLTYASQQLAEKKISQRRYDELFGQYYDELFGQ